MSAQKKNWKTPQVFLRSLLFNIYLLVSSSIIFVIFIPFLFLGKKIAMATPKFWGLNAVYAAKYIAGIDYVIKGDIPQKPVIFACKHQSAWETAVFHFLGQRTAYVLKKELLYIPFFNLYAFVSGQIAVDRGAGASAVKSLIRQTRERIATGRQVVIFPEGTRMPYGAAPNYKAGVAALYSSVDADIVPVALNSAKFWARNSFWKRPGTITLSILPAIGKGLSKQEFMQVLETRIEEECAVLDC